MYRRCCYTLTRTFIQSLQDTTPARSTQVAVLDCYRKKRPPLAPINTFSNVCMFHTSTSFKKQQRDRGPRAAEEDEVCEHINLPQYKEKLEKILDLMKEEYMDQLSLRTNIGTFERLLVKTNDGDIPLNQLGSIIQKNPTLIVINLSQSLGYVRNVMTALQNSGMNLNPQQDGPATIYIHIAKVSVEHREQLAKNARKLFNTTKVRLYDMYSKFLRKLKKEERLPVHTRISVEKTLLKLMNETENRAESMMKNKQKELVGKEK